MSEELIDKINDEHYKKIRLLIRKNMRNGIEVSTYKFPSSDERCPYWSYYYACDVIMDLFRRDGRDVYYEDPGKLIILHDNEINMIKKRNSLAKEKMLTEHAKTLHIKLKKK